MKKIVSRGACLFISNNSDSISCVTVTLLCLIDKKKGKGSKAGTGSLFPAAVFPCMLSVNSRAVDQNCGKAVSSQLLFHFHRIIHLFKRSDPDLI